MTSPYPFQDRLCGPNVHLENILQFPIIIQIRVGDRLRLAGGAMGRRTRVAYRLSDLIMRSYFQIIGAPNNARGALFLTNHSGEVISVVETQWAEGDHLHVPPKHIDVS